MQLSHFWPSQPELQLPGLILQPVSRGNSHPMIELLSKTFPDHVVYSLRYKACSSLSAVLRTVSIADAQWTCRLNKGREELKQGKVAAKPQTKNSFSAGSWELLIQVNFLKVNKYQLQGTVHAMNWNAITSDQQQEDDFCWHRTNIQTFLTSSSKKTQTPALDWLVEKALSLSFLFSPS